MGILRAALTLLFLAFVFPRVAFRLPFYSTKLERLIARYYEARDESMLIKSIPNVRWPIVSRGGHFTPFLEDSLAHSAGKPVKRKPYRYFEGWYYKMVSKDTRDTVIVIPCVFFDGEHEDDHAFIMVGKTVRDASGKVLSSDATFHKYPLSEVKLINYENDEKGFDRYQFSIGENVFTENQASLDIPGRVTGKIELTKVVEYPSTTFNPNIMGFFSFLDATIGMECVHKVVAIDSSTKGTLSFAGDIGNVDMTGGKAYVEGDYGSEFPSKWIWMQSNHFKSNPGSSFLLSVASIPFPNEKTTLFEFKGFLGFIYDASNKKIFRFGTYTGASIEVLGFDSGSLKGANKAEIVISDPQYVINITGTGDRTNPALLWGPRANNNGVLKMQKFVEEMLDAKFHVVIRKRLDDSIIFEDEGMNGGLEIEF
mmetsp:Transcript_3817/g.5123  ORF Transcript_3817/g.5123 Transcript_3817/m.5123 type:complete len:425 (-) Transcript_3817:1317-2591(-)